MGYSSRAWRAPSLVKLVNERKRLDRLIEDTCTEAHCQTGRRGEGTRFQAPAADTAHIGAGP